MTDKQIYQGEDFGMLLKLSSDEGQEQPNMDDYDFVILFSTKKMGRDVLASTMPNAEFPIERKNDGLLAINITGEQTKQFPQGELLLEVAVINKQTQCREIATTIFLTVKHSYLGTRCI